MSNILVTGANGFIGKNLIKKLKENNEYNILTFTKNDTSKDLERLIKKSDFIFHLAGEVKPNSTSQDFINSNVNLTQNIIDLLEKNNKSIPISLASTIHAKLLKNEYGITKRESEVIVEEYTKKYNQNSFIYRLPHVFGEGCKPNYNSVISTWIYNSLHDLDINVFDRSIEMSYVYVQDIVSEFISTINLESKLNYFEPKYIYNTTLGEVVDFINEFKKNINNKDYDIKNNKFKQKLFKTYRDYALKVKR